MTATIERPRLAGHVQARFHLTDGVAKVMLDDTRTGVILEIAPDDWRLLETADGTRDLDALCLAAARLGIYRGEAEIRQLLGELAEAGVLVDGLPVPAGDPLVARPPTPADRPLEGFPDYAFACDGRGSCCRFYGSVPFTPIDALHARLCAAERPAPVPSSHLLLPISGAQQAAEDLSVVAQIDGRCSFLNDDGRCGIHAGAGAAAKPIVCQTYPSLFVDDGEVVRVSPVPECACVFDSAERAGGGRLVPDELVTMADLHAMVVPSVVPEAIPITPSHTVPRAHLRTWSRSAHDVARASDRDAAGWALALAEGMGAEGLAQVDVPSAPLTSLGPWLEALRARAATVATTQATWRSTTDLSRRTAHWIANALEHADPLTAPAHPTTEGFYLAALLWGHRLTGAGRPLTHRLRDRATRILVSRSMRLVQAPDDRVSAHPLALVEAAVRNLGMARYADDL